MGQSSSNRRNNQFQNRPPPRPSQLLSSSSTPSSSSSSSFSSSTSSSSSSSIPTPPPPPPPSTTAITFSGFSPPPPPSTFPGFSPPPPPSYAFAANAPHPSPHYAPSTTYPTPPPSNYYSHYSPSSACGYAAPPLSNRFNYQPFYPNQHHGWSPYRPSSSFQPAPPVPPLPYVEHQKATTVRNDVNLHKETIKLEADEQNPDAHLVSFTFDALVDGSITIFYFAKEGANCSFSPQYPDNYMPVTVPFQKGLGQKFRQPPGTGIDLGFFVLEDLSKPTSDDVFPLVISAEACTPPSHTNEQPGQTRPTANAQITEAIIEKKNDEAFQVKVIKQILWVDGVRYELQELYGIENSAEPEFDDDDPGKECVICMSEPKDTAVLPCRHMCMCSECAKVLRFQTNRCPICRQPVERLIEIKMKRDNQ